ncbi:PD-(D/E)XK nuclease family protein [Algoriphagus terrigena]|uniref:PDDEXK-like family protein n=1 Tax=Algoriphagus terrigena TaxID=344884 RepID=UPI0004224FCB|nr:PD-(D/E)XK nuclease family protein [Algoriphagus terrigena]
MNEFLAAESLLNRVGLVVQNYEKNLRVSGNGFSFIHALDLESDEARFHTRLIGYLINPKAGHFQGDKFLKLFFEAIGIKEDTDGFTVEIEKHVGKRDWENIEGGRIDLLISNPYKNIGIAIELKIYAVEQQKQLHRYYNYLKNNFKSSESKVCFLTLVGDESQYYVDFKVYEKVSFREHIHKWIETCRLASIDQPIIRETLTQYIANIKRLTNQNPDDQMSDEIIKQITRNSESFKAFNSLKSTEYKLYQQFGEELVKSLKGISDFEDHFDIDFSGKNIPKSDAEISFWIKGSRTERIRLYWLSSGTVAIGMHVDLNISPLVVPIEVRNRFYETLVGNLSVGKYLQVGEAYHNWFWISEVKLLKNEPQLSFESWEKFRSKEFAEEVAGWVKAIANAYKEVQKEMARPFRK